MPDRMIVLFCQLKFGFVGFCDLFFITNCDISDIDSQNPKVGYGCEKYI